MDIEYQFLTYGSKSLFFNKTIIRRGPHTIGSVILTAQRRQDLQFGSAVHAAVAAAAAALSSVFHLRRFCHWRERRRFQIRSIHRPSRARRMASSDLTDSKEGKGGRRCQQCRRHSKIPKGFVTKTFGQTAYSQGNLTDGRIRDVRPVGARGTE